MESGALLSPTDITTIRRYVHTKFAPLPDGKRAEIVADAIRRALRQRLPDVPEELKQRMVDQLISRCLVRENRDVLAEDVFDIAAEIGEEGAGEPERWLEPIIAWANERAPGRWSDEQLASRLNRGRSMASAARKTYPQQTGDELIRSGDRAAKPAAFAARAARFVRPKPMLAALLGIAVLSGSAAWIAGSREVRTEPEANVAPAVPPPVELPRPQRDAGMPDRLRYAEIDVAALIAYLNSRDSLLAEEPYFGAIMASAKENDIHPHLLFAITGQEQGFVPRTGKEAPKIANNPFNVGHSWMDYNTDIEDSSGIAARLIAKLGKSRPEGHDPFEWFNRTYAEDPLWSVGVRKIFDKLNGLPPAARE